MSVFSRARDWELDVDRYLNRFLPPSPLHKLPTEVSRYLGYRKAQRRDVGNVLGAFWSMLGAFCGLAVIAAVFNNTESIQRHHPPALIASFVCLRLWLNLARVTDKIGCLRDIGVQRHSITTRSATQRFSRPRVLRTHWGGHVQALSVPLGL